MILKTVLSIMVLISCAYFGHLLKMKSDMHLNDLNNLLLCLQVLETEIRYSMNDIPDAAIRVSKIASGINKKIFELFAENINKFSDVPLSEIWTNTVNKICTDSIYGKNDIDALNTFGYVLGSGDLDTQLKNIEIFRVKTENCINDLKNEKDKKDPIYSKLFFYLGILAVIIVV